MGDQWLSASYETLCRPSTYVLRPFPARPRRVRGYAGAAAWKGGRPRSGSRVANASRAGEARRYSRAHFWQSTVKGAKAGLCRAHADQTWPARSRDSRRFRQIYAVVAHLQMVYKADSPGPTRLRRGGRRRAMVTRDHRVRPHPAVAKTALETGDTVLLPRKRTTNDRLRVRKPPSTPVMSPPVPTATTPGRRWTATTSMALCWMCT
jgi:hypothetical protein